MHQVIQGAQHLFQRRLHIDVMDVVNVDVIHLQTAQAVLDGLHDVDPRHARIVDAFAHRVEEFGRHNGVAAAALERLAQHNLGFAIAIGVGGIEEVDPGL